MNLSEVQSFYSKQKDGQCKFFEKRGARMGSKCANPTESLFCNEHQKYGVDGDKAVNFLQTLASNPEMLDKLLDSALFLYTHHLCDECDDDGCDECISEDTEDDFEHKVLYAVADVLFANDGPTVSPQEIPVANVHQTSNVLTTEVLSVPNLPQIPTGSPSRVPIVPNVPEQTTSNSIQVAVYGNNYREVNHGWILGQVDNDIVLLEDETEKHLQCKVNDYIRKLAQSMGIKIL